MPCSSTCFAKQSMSASGYRDQFIAGPVHANSATASGSWQWCIMNRLTMSLDHVFTLQRQTNGWLCCLIGLRCVGLEAIGPPAGRLSRLQRELHSCRSTRYMCCKQTLEWGVCSVSVLAAIVLRQMCSFMGGHFLGIMGTK